MDYSSLDPLFNEAISPEERKAITDYTKTLKAWLTKNYPDTKWRVSSGTSVRPNPYLTAQAENVPNELRQLIMNKIFGGEGSMRGGNWDDVQYGNVDRHRLALHLSEWKKITGDEAAPVPASETKKEETMKENNDYSSLDRFLGGKPTLSGKVINESTDDDIKTEAGKKKFIKDITARLQEEMLKHVSKMPEDWNGIELRQYMVDTASGFLLGSMDIARKKKYKNTINVENL
jgi:hypothetical protein